MRLWGIVSFLFIVFSVCVARGNNPRFAPIPTDVCDVTALSDLVDLQTKVNYERIACEGGQFSGYECSRYWMLESDLLRKKLSFKACLDRKRDGFRNWAGTRHVNGVFQNDYAETLQLEQSTNSALRTLLGNEHNATLTLLLDGTRTTLAQLVALENALAASERSNTYNEAAIERANISSQAKQTRNLVATSGSEERTLVRLEFNNTRVAAQVDGTTSRANTTAENTLTRNKDIAEETASRANFTAESQATRARDSQEEQADRDLFTLRSQQIRALDTQEETDTRTLFTTESQNIRTLDQTEEQTTRDDDARESQETRDKDIAEETATRAADTLAEQNTRALDQQEEQTTRDLFELRSQENRALDTQEETSSRALFTQESQDSRAFVAQQHQTTRTLISGEHSSMRAEEDAQSNHTRQTWATASTTAAATIVSLHASNKVATDAVVIQETATTRSTIAASAANTTAGVNLQQRLNRVTLAPIHANQSSITNSLVNEKATNFQSAADSATASVASTWNGAASNILAAALAFQTGIPRTLFDQLAIHMALYQTYTKGYPTVEYYSRTDKFESLRSTANSTLAYNLAKYGSTSNSRAAATYWSSGEAYRTSNDFRRAVVKYSYAYVYAIAP